MTEQLDLRNFKAAIHQVPANHFKNRGLSGEQRVAAEEAMPVFDHEGQAPEGHILTYQKGALYPEKGTKDPGIIDRLNVIKHLINSDLQAFGTKYALLPAIGFLFTPWRFKIKMLEPKLVGWLRTCHSIIGGDFLNDNEYQPICKELWEILTKGMVAAGFVDGLAHGVGECCIMPIEFDDAYRYPLLDIFSEIIPAQMLANPRKEFKRLGKIYLQREHRPGMRDKMGNIFRLLNIFLLLPRGKRIVKAAFKDCNFERLKSDMSDAYYCLRREEAYDFGGYPFPNRWNYYVQLHTAKDGTVHLPPMVTYRWVEGPANAN